jgi:protein SCO1/2
MESKRAAPSRAGPILGAAMTIAALSAFGDAGPAVAHSGHSHWSAEARRAAIQSADFGGPFTLTDHNGNTVSDRDFRGKLMLVYFGYTTCRDICPADVQNMAAAIDRLGRRGEDVVPIFITLDPGRDTPARLKQFLAPVHPRFVGLTGTVEEIDRVAELYRVEFQRMEERGPEDYIVGHPGLMYIMGRTGEFLTLIPPLTDGDAMAEEIAKLLE